MMLMNRYQQFVSMTKIKTFLQVIVAKQQLNSTAYRKGAC